MKFLILPLLLFGISTMAADRSACPSWEVIVVDEAGKPVAGHSVLQEWGAKSGEQSTNATASAFTDGEGRVQFPSRQIRPPREKNPLKKMGRIIDGEKSSEVWASVFVGGTGYKSVWVRAWNDPLIVATTNGFRTRITLKKDK